MGFPGAGGVPQDNERIDVYCRPSVNVTVVKLNLDLNLTLLQEFGSTIDGTFREWLPF